MKTFLRLLGFLRPYRRGVIWSFVLAGIAMVAGVAIPALVGSTIDAVRKGDDSVVKLRPVVPQELPDSLKARPGFGVEVDAMPGGFVCSGRLKSSLRRGKVKEAVDGDRAARSLFNKAQRSFFAEHAPEGTEIDDLSILGPITVLKLKFTPPGYDRRLVAELWTYPDGSRILELSTKCAPSEAFQVAAETRVYLEERGIDLSGEQATKTRTALEFFSR